MVLWSGGVEDAKIVQGVLVQRGGDLPPWERVLWFRSRMQRGRECVIDFLCGAVPRGMDRQIRWIRDNLERGPEHQVSMVELLQAR